MSYHDLRAALNGLLQAFPVDRRRGAEATYERCPACGAEKVEFDDDTSPERLLPCPASCPRRRAEDAQMYHEKPFHAREDLVEAVARLLENRHPETYRTARAILQALDARVRCRKEIL